MIATTAFLSCLWPMMIGAGATETPRAGATQATLLPDVNRAAKELEKCVADNRLLAARLLDAAGVSVGRFLAPACAKPRVDVLLLDTSEDLALALARLDESLRIYLVSSNPASVDAMRSAIDRAGFYGRITCRAEDPKCIFFPTYFFDVVVVRDIPLEERSFAEVFRLLKPDKRAVVLSRCDAAGWLRTLDAPGAAQTAVATSGGVTVLHRAYDESGNRFLRLPLVRLWVTTADRSAVEQADKVAAEYLPQGNNFPGHTVGVLRGDKGEVVTDADPRQNFALFMRVPLDAYTGRIVKPEPKYAGRELEFYGHPGEAAVALRGILHEHSRLIQATRFYMKDGKQVTEEFDVKQQKPRSAKAAALLREFADVQSRAKDPNDAEVQAAADRVLQELMRLDEPPPYEYVLLSYHGDMGARDNDTQEVVWKNDMHRLGLWSTCCPLFRYVNGVVYKVHYRSILALHPLTGKLLWWHRTGGTCCAQMAVARSLIFQPNVRYFPSASPHMQTFIAQQYAGSVPPGDRLVTVAVRGAPLVVPPSGGLAAESRLKAALRTENAKRADDWPMFHYDACRTGVSPDRAVKPPLKVLWMCRTGEAVRSSPAVVDGVVYVGSCDHKFYALDAATGAVKWVFFADDEIRSSPCVCQNAVYFGSDDGKVYALDKESGKLIWAYQTATSVPPSLHYDYKSKNLVKSGHKPSRSCTPLCFNGQPLSTPGVVRSSPVVAGGVLYVGTGLGIDGRPCWGYLYALEAATGKLLWKATEADITQECEEPARGITSPPCVIDGRVHFTYGVYTALDAANGKLLLKGGTMSLDERPRRTAPPPSYTGPDGQETHYWLHTRHHDGWGVRGAVTIARKQQTAVLVSGLCDREGDRSVADQLRFGSRVWAVDLRTGRVKWEGRYESNFHKEKGWSKFSGPLPYEQPAVIHEGRVYVGGDKGVAVFDLEKGGTQKIDVAARWSDKRLDGYYDPAPWDDRVFKPAATLAGPEDLVFTSPAVANGFLIAGADDGAVYAWKVDAADKAAAERAPAPPTWKQQLAEGVKVRSSPAIARGRVYFGADDGCVYCLGNAE